MNVYSSLRARIVLAALTSLSPAAFFSAPLHADAMNALSPSQSHCRIRGVVRRIDPATDHLTLIGDDDHVYIVDAYHAAIILPDITRSADTRDLMRGMHVRTIGTLVGSDLIEATTVRVVSDAVPLSARRQPLYEDQPDFEVLSDSRASLDGIVRGVDPDQNHITITTDDGVREVVDTRDATITLPDGRALGQTADLVRGMRVQVTGMRLPHGRMVAEQIRVVPEADESRPSAPMVSLPLPEPTVPQRPATLPAFGLTPPSPDPQFVLAHLDSYTGILIDTRHLGTISRSPAPNIFGPEPGESLLYPDRSHVPTPDAVQDESVVRYYRTPAEAQAGVCGDNPLILPAQAVLTPAQDSVQLSRSDMILFNALDQKLHFTRTWKVGFLVPGDK